MSRLRSFDAPSSPSLRCARRGFTLIEMLVSLTVTLMMMAAVVTLFSTVTDTVTGSRSVIEMSERLRHARNVLQADLEGATVKMVPPVRPDDDMGYFEYIEGPYTDRDWLHKSDGIPLPQLYPSVTVMPDPPNRSVIGENDDVLMFTVRSARDPFIGRMAGQPIESMTAEVCYFAVPNGPILDATTNPVTRLYTLYRRVLLVRPGLRANPSFTAALSTNWYDTNDVSVRIGRTNGQPVLVPNTLGDLTNHASRFAHNNPTGVFPFCLNADQESIPNRPNSASAFLVPLDGQRIGDDVLMTNVLAFDVQVYDPGAPQFGHSGTSTIPPDYGFKQQLDTWVSAGYPYNPPPWNQPPDYIQPNPKQPVFGAYADLGYTYVAPSPPRPYPLPSFNAASQQAQPSGTSLISTLKLPTVKAAEIGGVQANPNVNASGSNAPGFVYDTWSLYYENDGLDQGTGKPDFGTNGLDDNNDGLVDDISEFETLPPFQSRVRGIRVIIRAYEPSSQQVREVTIVQDFLAE